MKVLELLAPARDKESAYAAIDCGADAIYIGASLFGARQSAGNSTEDIASVVEYAHRYGVRVHAALTTNNTMSGKHNCVFDNTSNMPKKKRKSFSRKIKPSVRLIQG